MLVNENDGVAMKHKWFVYTCCLMGMAAKAQQSGYEQLMFDPAIHKTATKSHDFKFDSSTLLQNNNLTTHPAIYGQQFQFNRRLSGGLFVYRTDSPMQALSLPSSVSSSVNQNNNLYMHLLTRLMSHLFFDVAGGYGSNVSNAKYYLSNQQNLNGYSKNWFASAAALFTHTWKEFVFSANLSAMRGDAQQDPYTPYLSYRSTLVPNNLAKMSSFLQENAEIRYRGNPFVQPFIAGGLLQIIDANNLSANAVPFSPLPEFNQDLNGYKVGGGLAFNYKQYIFRLEQQYYQRGNLYHGNQSTLSVKMNLG